MGRATSEQYIWKYILYLQSQEGGKKGNSKESLEILINLPCEIFAKECINIIFLSKIGSISAIFQVCRAYVKDCKNK